MDKATKNIKKVVVIVTILFFVFEWLLLELIRLPYRPPEDMFTLLGTEKYWVMGFMALLALVWLVAPTITMASFQFTIKDYGIYGLLLAGLIASVVLIAIWPPWVVTPLKWILN